MGKGNPDPDSAATAHIEMRMSMRRFTRKTNGFSKKLKNHRMAVNLHFFAYNFVRIHQSLMEAGVTDRLWELDDLVRMGWIRGIPDLGDEAPTVGWAGPG